jgi:hypothetical protein
MPWTLFKKFESAAKVIRLLKRVHSPAALRASRADATAWRMPSERLAHTMRGLMRRRLSTLPPASARRRMPLGAGRLCLLGVPEVRVAFRTAPPANGAKRHQPLSLHGSRIEGPSRGRPFRLAEIRRCKRLTSPPRAPASRRPSLYLPRVT